MKCFRVTEVSSSLNTKTIVMRCSLCGYQDMHTFEIYEFVTLKGASMHCPNPKCPSRKEVSRARAKQTVSTAP